MYGTAVFRFQKPTQVSTKRGERRAGDGARGPASKQTVAWTITARPTAAGGRTDGRMDLRARRQEKFGARLDVMPLNFGAEQNFRGPLSYVASF